MKNLILKNLKATFMALYVLLLICGFLFVRNALNDDSIAISEKEEETQKQEEKPIKVSISINQGNNNKSYILNMKNTQTILDAIDNLRQDEEISYEKTAYSYGTEIDHIDNFRPIQGYRWGVFLQTNEKSVKDQENNIKLNKKEKKILNESIDQEIDVTYEIESISLVDEAVISIRPIQIEELL